MPNIDTGQSEDEYTKTHPFELIVGDPGGEILNGDVAVRWCVTPTLVGQLESDGIIDPHVLLVSSNKGREMQRQMVPITELMTYVRFTRAGEQDLFGFIVSGKEGRKKLNTTYFRKTNGNYETDIMFNYTNEPHDNLPCEYCRTSVKVLIPAGVFGKEPGPLLKWYVNAWHSNTGRIVDECHYRQRLIIALSLKAVPFILWTLLLILGRFCCAAALMLAGYVKGNNIMRAFRPYKWTDIAMHMFDEIDLSKNPLIYTRKYAYHNKRSERQEAKHYNMLFTIPFIPLVLVIQAILIGMFAEYFGETMFTTSAIMIVIFIAADAIVASKKWFENTSVFQMLADALVIRLDKVCELIDANPLIARVAGWAASLGILGLAGYMFFLASGILAVILGTLAVIVLHVIAFIKFFGPFVLWLENIYGISADQNNYGEIKELLCPADENNLRPRYSYIPPKQRTIRLWYLDIKNKVCKPMQS